MIYMNLVFSYIIFEYFMKIMVRFSITVLTFFFSKLFYRWCHHLGSKFSGGAQLLIAKGT